MESFSHREMLALLNKLVMTQNQIHEKASSNSKIFIIEMQSIKLKMAGTYDC